LKVYKKYYLIILALPNSINRYKTHVLIKIAPHLDGLSRGTDRCKSINHVLLITVRSIQTVHRHTWTRLEDPYRTTVQLTK